MQIEYSVVQYSSFASYGISKVVSFNLFFCFFFYIYFRMKSLFIFHENAEIKSLLLLYYYYYYH